MGSEYKIKFKLIVHEMKKMKEPYNILAFTADKGIEDPEYLKYGDYNPSVCVKDDEVIIKTPISGDPAFLTKVPLTLGKWMTIEICQHVIDKKVTYSTTGCSFEPVISKEEVNVLLFLKQCFLAADL